MTGSEDVKNAAELAKIYIDSGELDPLTRDFNAILKYIDQLQSLDVDEIEPLSHVHGSQNIMRDDEATDGLQNEEGLEEAPEKGSGFFKVPLVINTGD